MTPSSSSRTSSGISRRSRLEMQAAIDGSREIGFTIVSMTVSLIAVFIPILLMGGIVGRLFREFAVTVSIAIVMSGIVSLTVTPMMCAWLIRHRPDEAHGRLYRASERIFEAMINIYGRTLDRVLRHPVLTLAVTLATLGATLWLYTVTPKGFFPQADTGLIMHVAQAPPDVPFYAMSGRIQALGRIVMADPDVDNVYYWIGPNPTVSQGRMMINLKQFGERRATAAAVPPPLQPKSASGAGIAPSLPER